MTDKKLTDEEVINLEIETGNPICLELDDNLNVINDYNKQKLSNKIKFNGGFKYDLYKWTRSWW